MPKVLLLLRSVDFFLFFLFVRFCVFHFFVSAHRRPLDSSRAPPTNNNVHFFEFSFARNDSQALLARTSPVNTHTHDSIMCDQLRATFHWPPAYMTRSRSLHGAGELNENNNYVARSLALAISFNLVGVVASSEDPRGAARRGDTVVGGAADPSAPARGRRQVERSLRHWEKSRRAGEKPDAVCSEFSCNATRLADYPLVRSRSLARCRVEFRLWRDLRRRRRCHCCFGSVAHTPPGCRRPLHAIVDERASERQHTC